MYATVFNANFDYYEIFTQLKKHNVIPVKDIKL